jgi:hypothetical protein
MSGELEASPDAADESAGGARNLEYEQARLAYQIIQALLEHLAFLVP